MSYTHRLELIKGIRAKRRTPIFIQTERKVKTVKQKGAARVKKLDKFVQSMSKEQAAAFLREISQTTEGQQILKEIEDEQRQEGEDYSD